jgi:hypothetical protein
VIPATIERSVLSGKAAVHCTLGQGRYFKWLTINTVQIWMLLNPSGRNAPSRFNARISGCALRLPFYPMTATANKRTDNGTFRVAFPLVGAIGVRHIRHCRQQHYQYQFIQHEMFLP